MSNPQPNAWQTAGRSRHSHSASRTPQNRSGTASPNPQATTTPARQDGGRPQQQTNNVWTQRSSSAGGSNGQRVEQQQPSQTEEQAHEPVNGFNAAEVLAFLSRDPMPASYKPAESAGAGRGSGSGSAWGSKPSHMANGQPFIPQLMKQVAALEDGG